MDTQSQENLNRILALEPKALTEADVAFLRARVSYLTSDQRERFASMLKVEEAPVVALQEMDRKQLEKVAKKLGIKSKDFPEDADLVAAIEAAQEEVNQ